MAQVSVVAAANVGECSSVILRSVFESSAATGSTDELLQHVAFDLPERCCLSHLSQVVHTELKAEFFEVLNEKE